MQKGILWLKKWVVNHMFEEDGTSASKNESCGWRRGIVWMKRFRIHKFFRWSTSILLCAFKRFVWCPRVVPGCGFPVVFSDHNKASIQTVSWSKTRGFEAQLRHAEILENMSICVLRCLRSIKPNRTGILFRTKTFWNLKNELPNNLWWKDQLFPSFPHLF